MSQLVQPQPRISDLERGGDSRLDGNPQSISDKLRAYYSSLPLPLRKTLDWISDKFDIESKWGHTLYIAACMIFILMYPMRHYAGVVNPDKNCLDMDDAFEAIFQVFAAAIYYMLLCAPNVFKKLIQNRCISKTAMQYLFTIAPLFSFTMVTMAADDISNNVCLAVYILLVIILSSLIIKNATEDIGYIAQAKWTKVGFNLFLYLLGGHVFGAFWYSFAVVRILDCWREDYFLRNNFDPHSFYCRDKHKNIGELNCPKMKRNASGITEFGIFNDALQSRIVDVEGQFLKKFLYCLRWGLQALSCFGQNLSPSTFIMENIFVVSIIIYSTVLFVFLIGNMQTYLAPEAKSEKQKEGEQMVSQQIKNLPNKYSKHHKKRELWLDLLKKVDEFGNWNETTLDELCDCLRPAFYVERTRIVREGDPIDEMLFVLQGKLWTYSSKGTATASPRTNHHHSEENLLKEGDFFGKELVSWVRADASLSSLPISTRTIQALTNVDAFALMAYDLRQIFIQHNQELVSDNVSLVSSEQQQGEPEITAQEH